MATGELDGVDYSFDPPDDLAGYQALYARGVRCFARYLTPSSGKDFTATEIRWIHSLSPDVFAHFLSEGMAGEALQGYQAGYNRGKFIAAAIATLQNGVGYKQHNRPGVSFAVDFDTSPSQYPAIESYFRGIHDAAGGFLVGAYGEADLLDHLAARHLIDFGFQTYAWSGGRVSVHAALYQYLNGQRLDGATVDFDQVNNAKALGGWYRPGSPFDTNGALDMSQYGPQHWDAADYTALGAHLRTDKPFAAAVHAATFGSFNTDPANPAQGPVSAWTVVRTALRQAGLARAQARVQAKAVKAAGKKVA